MIQRIINFFTRFDAEYYNNIKKKVAFAPIKKQATFADPICKKNVLNEDFLQDQFKDFDPDNTDFSAWNVTSIGNVAYIALYSKNEDIKAKCLKSINNYQEYISLFS